MQRLDKILSEAGVASRKELRNMIRARRVTVDGVVARSPEDKFDETTICVLVDGVPVRKMEHVYLMLHKPAGYVTSTSDPRDKTVMELLPEEYRKLDLKPVGRLDKETEGLLLFTNDGDFAHRMISPRSGVWKVYFAQHEGTATDEDVAAFQNGIVLKDGTQCLPAELVPQGPGESLIRVCEGKYHQVRRMMASRDMAVTYLKRIEEGNLSLDGLEKGCVRELKSVEIADLL